MSDPGEKVRYKEMSTREVGPMGIVVERVDPRTAKARRRAIRRELGMSADVLRDRARSFELNARERALAREYERLEFLAPDGR